jgi:hypothetical protein
MVASLEQALREATHGLLYRSETDEPFEPVSWPDQGELTAAKVRALGEHPPDAKVRETSLDQFFETLTTDQHWHSPAEKEAVQQYRSLLKLIRTRLKEPKVFRVGEREVTICIVGRTLEGTWAGLMTWAVET